MNAMRKLIGLKLSLLFALASQGAAAAEQYVESGIESSTTVVQLPPQAPASIAVRSCLGCPTKTLQITNETRFYAGNDEVTLQELNALAAQAGTGLYFFYDAKAKVITRIKVDAVKSDAAPARKPRRR